MTFSNVHRTFSSFSLMLSLLSKVILFILNLKTLPLFFRVQFGFASPVLFEVGEVAFEERGDVEVVGAALFA